MKEVEISRRYFNNICISDVPSVCGELPGPHSIALYKEVEENTHGFSTQTKLLPLAFSNGLNEILIDVDGNQFIDMTSGTYCAALGHANKRIRDIVAYQFGDLVNCHSWMSRAKADGIKALRTITPVGLDQFQFYCEGTVAVEAALRLCNLYRPLDYIACFNGSFHGKTAGSSLLTSRPIKGSLFDRYEGNVIVFDYNERGIDELYDTDYPISAVFVEPIQGVSGCVVPPAGMIDHLREFCSYKGALLIVDEIFTGFGRTGEIWASKVQPDILLFGKIAGGGYPLSGLATTKAIADLFEGSSVTTTYGANPVSLAVLSETVDMITDERLLDHVREIGCYMGAHLDNMCQCGYISRLGGAGCMWGFQFENDKQGERAFLELARRGVLTQIEGRVARLCPPMTSRLSVIQKAIEIIEDVIDEDYR